MFSETLLTYSALDPDHRVIESIGGDFRTVDPLGLFQRLSPNNLNPVIVWVFSEGNAAHSAICELFLERIAGIFYPFTGGLDVVHTDANVSEAFAWVRVTVGDLVVWIRFLKAG